MPCLKCGAELENGGVFCQTCLADMEAHPVKAGTRVTIPVRPKSEPVHAAPRVQTPEEIIEKLRRRIRFLLTLVMLLVLCLSVSVGLIVHHRATTEHGGLAIGQNYSTEAPDDVDHGR